MGHASWGDRTPVSQFRAGRSTIELKRRVLEAGLEPAHFLVQSQVTRVPYQLGHSRLCCALRKPNERIELSSVVYKTTASPQCLLGGFICKLCPSCIQKEWPRFF